VSGVSAGAEVRFFSIRAMGERSHLAFFEPCFAALLCRFCAGLIFLLLLVNPYSNYFTTVAGRAMTYTYDGIPLIIPILAAGYLLVIYVLLMLVQRSRA
jgi:hypothetical protein